MKDIRGKLYKHGPEVVVLSDGIFYSFVGFQKTNNQSSTNSHNVS